MTFFALMVALFTIICDITFCYHFKMSDITFYYHDTIFYRRDSSILEVIHFSF